MVAQQELPSNIVETLSHQNIKEGLTGFLAKTLEPSVLKLSDYPPYLPYGSLFEEGGYKSVAFLPLIAWNALAGAMLLCSRKEIDQADLTSDLLRLVSEQCGVGLENARQFERIRASELQYLSAVEEAPDVIYTARANGSYVLLSPRVESLVGYKPVEFIKNPESWRALVHPDERSEYSKRISAQGTGAESVELRYRVLPKGKASYRWIRDAFRYVRDSDGSVVAIHGVMSDISEAVDSSKVSGGEEREREQLPL